MAESNKHAGDGPTASAKNAAIGRRFTRRRKTVPGVPALALETVPVVVLILVLLVAGPSVLTSYWVGLLTQMMIFAILAMSLDLLLGYTGLPSLGHAGFFGVAAYAVAVLSTTYHAGFWTCVMSGILVGTLFFFQQKTAYELLA